VFVAESTPGFGPPTSVLNAVKDQDAIRMRLGFDFGTDVDKFIVYCMAHFQLDLVLMSKVKALQ
jgi:hypothetical protein